MRPTGSPGRAFAGADDVAHVREPICAPGAIAGPMRAIMREARRRKRRGAPSPELPGADCRFRWRPDPYRASPALQVAGADPELRRLLPVCLARPPRAFCWGSLSPRQLCAYLLYLSSASRRSGNHSVSRLIGHADSAKELESGKSVLKYGERSAMLGRQ